MLDHVDLQSFCRHLDSAQSSDQLSLHQHVKKKKTHMGY